jgi:transposase-like protein
VDHGHDDVWMVDIEVSGGLEASPRRRRSAEESRLIVEETLEAGSSVARVATAWHQREPGISVATALSQWPSWRASLKRVEAVGGDGA